MVPIWVVVNCSSFEEAQNIGEMAMAERLAACFDIFDRELSAYFWPPKSGRVESGDGTTLLLTSLVSKYPRLFKLVSEQHSDKVPFIAYWKLEGINPNYLKWLENELS